ncbi:pre-60S ribosomal particles component [Diatrype stigma]|uniref:Pre-60S ribosomal particles component n=1 Tax=Diatrype stigma TaxID=117547 RepID=A0AAN9YPF9_9PEZI
MAGPTRKRNHQDDGSKLSKSQNKRQKKRQFEYHSDSDEEDSNPDFKPVNLLDSDNEDLDNIAVDDVASASSGSDSDSDSAASSGEETSRQKPAKSAAAAAARSKKRKTEAAAKAEASGSKSDKAGDESEEDNNDNNINGASDEEGDENSNEEEEDDDDNESSDEEGADGALTSTTTRRTGANKSKRNDPTAFATSLSKILSTKLSTGRRADPVLARSADAQQAAREVLDSALEAKARKQMREQRRLAQEKGRVRDVLGGGVSAGVGVGLPTDAQRKKAITGGGGGDAGAAAYTQQAERRLRKVAHRGVVVLFRAVREAQERAAQAERDARRDGVYGVKTREEKVSEMSRQGFLDLIANGGGKLKQGALEEA